MLYVYMNNMLVGTLLQNSDGALQFQYASSWLEWPNARPISLSMPLTISSYYGDVVYNFFDNLLPDSKLIRDRIQRRFKSKTNRCFDLLSYIGLDCVGALQLLLEPLDTISIPEISGAVITNKEIADLLMHYKTAPLGMQEDSAFRISIAGAQEKTALLWHKKSWYLPDGVTPTTHILKLPIGRIEHAGIDLSDSVENEWLCMQILKEYELPTANAVITTFDTVKTLVVERFDRVWLDANKRILRIPQEDLCQALGVSANLKYESDGGPGIKSIMDILSGSKQPEKDRYNFMKSVFMFWILAAIDGHAKNFSLIIEPGGKYTLAPLYDVLSAYPLMAVRNLEMKKIKMAMAVKGKTKHYRWHEIQLRHWFSTAEECKFPRQSMKKIIDEIFDNMEPVISQVNNNLTGKEIEAMGSYVFKGMQNLRDSAAKSLV